jgi:hypothetical protein
MMNRTVKFQAIRTQTSGKKEQLVDQITTPELCTLVGDKEYQVRMWEYDVLDVLKGPRPFLQRQFRQGGLVPGQGPGGLVINVNRRRDLPFK